MTAHDLVPFLSSIAIGLLIGLERERSHPTGTHQAAGSRTFALLALSGTMAASIGSWVVVAGLSAAAALIAIGYLTTSSRDPGATTEVAALATFPSRRARLEADRYRRRARDHRACPADVERSDPFVRP